MDGATVNTYVVCSVDDMKAAERFVQRGWSKGKENKLQGSGHQGTMQTRRISMQVTLAC
jgi:hypothetical protein